MAKSVYSLVLNNDVIAAIDALAVRQGQSRSAFVNHILAEYANLSTPEKRKQEITEITGRMVQQSFNITVTPGGTLTLRTALQYKYNPSLSYVVQMDETQGNLGEVRVALRSQNETLLAHLAGFFSLWQVLEAQTHTGPPLGEYIEQSNRYVRLLRQVQSWQSKQTGEAIASYITLLDDCLKAFFQFPGDVDAAQIAASHVYKTRWPQIGDAAKL